METSQTVDKLERLFLDQKLFGVFSRLLGHYTFHTSKIGTESYEMSFINHEGLNPILKKVNLTKGAELVMSFDVFETANYKTLGFKVARETPFNFLYFCVAFKFFYQYLKQNTNYEQLLLTATRYQSYIFKALLGFQMQGWSKEHFFLSFDMKDGLQLIWEEYYGTGLEENLYNFMLPVEAGGFVPSNIKVKTANSPTTVVMDMKKTEKKYFQGEKPLAQIKVGYDLHSISILNLSESGLSFVVHAHEDTPGFPPVQMGHIYSLWLNSDQLNMKWTNLSVQVVWEKDHVFGCRIRENSAAWRQFILMMNIKDHERLTFTDKNPQI